jgi:predicted lipoprotein with Yx(FWY)xxD motif
MRHPLKLTVPLLAASVLLAACGSSSHNTTGTTTSRPAAQTTGSASATVKTASSPLGTILVDSKGMTLYHLSAEHGGKFICTSTGCTGIWHPLTIVAGSTPTGGVAALGTVKRPDGTLQVTYKGAPLYTFAQDQRPGETKGQGFKDVGTWMAATAGSSTSSSSTQTTPPASEEGGGYHY